MELIYTSLAINLTLSGCFCLSCIRDVLVIADASEKQPRPVPLGFLNFLATLNKF
ncbi:hypothetical protein HBZC1_13310 [Helicobacter bizzozeronii CIII-1]|uniref:Uncharacterized protein n=1 Tax=Helicobacter bizzozeronii (strain CIII-1) TaxID=1002804 RepID=F8KTY4_HELBC|nr:hypothetical protein HBZC1_13310 [Helicobacter bizzozeronii CIII-1]